MYHYLYKITNSINGKYYYGAHSTKKLNDNYLGSGRALSFAKKKYGKSAFTLQILKYFDTKEDLYDAEALLITEAVINNPLSYNEKVGGFGGWDHINSRGNLCGINNPMHREDVKQKVIATSRKNGSYHTEKRKSAQIAATLAAVVSNTGRSRPEHSAFMKEWSIKNWENNKEIMRDKLSSTYVITDPNGVQYTTNRLGEFCKTNNLPFVTMYTICNKGVSAKKGRCKDWFIEKVNND